MKNTLSRLVFIVGAFAAISVAPLAQAYDGPQRPPMEREYRPGVRADVRFSTEPVRYHDRWAREEWREHRRQEWREREWREHEWRRHHGWEPRPHWHRY